MEDYTFASLDDNDVQDLTSLERRLSAKHRRPVVLVAYAEHTGAEGENELASLLDAGMDPAVYGSVQVAQETGAAKEATLVGITD